MGLIGTRELGQGLSLHMPWRLRLYRRELSGVEREVPASREVGSVRGRKH